MSSPVKLAGAGKPQHEAAIEPLSLRRPDIPEARVARLRDPAAKRLEHVARRRPRDADHGDGGKAGAARGRNDGVVCGDDLGGHCVILGRGEKEGPCRSGSKVTFWGRRRAPISSSTRTTPCIGAPGAQAALAEARATGKPILLSVGYAACHWCHVMAHESFEDEATAARHERPVREHQGGSRGAPRCRCDLYGGAARARRAGRLAAHHVPHLRRRAVLGRHLFPQGRTLWAAGICPCTE